MDDEAESRSLNADAGPEGHQPAGTDATTFVPTTARPLDSPDKRPLLGDAELDTFRRYGTEVAVDVGEILFCDGDEKYDLIVILNGRVEIIDQVGTPNEALVIDYGPREFLGEMSLLTGQRAFLTARVSEAGHVVRIAAEQVRVIIAQEPDLSEILLRAFLARHARLTRRGAGLTLVGSRFDPNTRKLLEVLARNRLPFRWLELESSPEAEAMLRQLHVPVSDLPLVVAPGGALLRNPDGHSLLGALGLAGAPEHDGSEVCDLLVVGAGPAGLSAAVYGASEGMTTILAEDTALGGQAGTSSRI